MLVGGVVVQMQVRACLCPPACVGGVKNLPTFVPILQEFLFLSDTYVYIAAFRAGKINITPKNENSK